MKADSSYARVVFRKALGINATREDFRFSTKQNRTQPDTPLLKQRLAEEITFVFENSSNVDFPMGHGIYCSKNLPCVVNGTFLEKTFTGRDLLTTKQQTATARTVFTKLLQPISPTHYITRLMHHLIEGYLSPVPDSGFTNFGYSVV